MEKKVKKITEKAPQGPGIYQFIDEKGEVIYVGKAKSLRKRLQSYFRNSADHGIKTAKLLEKVKDVKWVETNSEIEALILEDNLIKELQPKYNILLKDDKTFQYIKVSVQEDYPEVTTVRKIEKDGAKYFGPKTSGTDVQRLMESVKRIFKLCSVHGIKLDPSGIPLEGAKVAVKVGGTSAKRPCLDYHIKRCSGPCAGMVTPKEYRVQINEALEFLAGKYESAIKLLKEQMMEWAAQKKFERAAAVRDQIAAIERSAEKQLITGTKLEDRDVIAYVEDMGKNYFNLFQIRSGRLISHENFILEGGELPTEIMESFLRDYYALAADIPKEIIISIQVEEPELIEDYISKFTDHKVHLIHPEKGVKDDLVILAEKNARSFAQQNRIRWMVDEHKSEKALLQLKEALGLSEPPKRIECYDISHLSGTETVGSMTVFKKGEPAKEDYRQFRLKTTVGQIDDFKSMAEVIRRRLNYLPAKLPEGYLLRKAKKSDLKDLDYKTYFVIEKKKKIVAHACIRTLSEKVPQVDDLWVDDKERGRKLGHHLIKALIEKSKATRFYIFCKPELEPYYLLFGFERIHEAPKELKKVAKPNRIFMAYQKRKKDPSFSACPDLMVIDGGKGQLTSAYGVLHEKHLRIPMIALAKRLEEVFIPEKPDPINLPNSSEGSYLLQRIRDEAHRFAIEFNRESRLKNMTRSWLDQIPGVGPKLKQRLLTHFGSVQAVREASLEQLIPLCGEMVAKKMKEMI